MRSPGLSEQTLYRLLIGLCCLGTRFRLKYLLFDSLCLFACSPLFSIVNRKGLDQLLTDIMLVTTTTLEDYVVATNCLKGTSEGSILRYDKNTLTRCQPTCKIIFHNQSVYMDM